MSDRFSANLLKGVSVTADMYFSPLNCQRRMFLISYKPSSSVSICLFQIIIGILPHSSTKDPFFLIRSVLLGTGSALLSPKRTMP